MTSWTLHFQNTIELGAFFHLAAESTKPRCAQCYICHVVSLNKITLEFTDRILFDEIGFLITREDRIGLVGRNGAGKSTLLKVLAREMEVDGGELAITSGCTIGYLPQELDLVDKYPLMVEMEHSMPELVRLEEEIEQINEQLAHRTDYESEGYMQLIQDLNDHTERYGMLGGYTFRAEIERILKGLGFTPADFDAHTSTFSGGWRMRVELAKLLVRKHDLLLLDEPTNHLDIESILWLEEFLKDYPGGIVLVSHDRAFLDSVTNRTIELSFGKAYDFPVSYTRFVAQRAEQRELQLAARKNQEKEIKRTEQLIEKFRYKATKASFAQSLIKKLDRIDLIEVDDEDNREMKFRFPPAPRSGRVVVNCEHVSKSFEDKLVLNRIEFRLERQERIAFVGQNGQGKSTLVKIITGLLDAEGKVELGHNVALGYYAQNQADALDGEKTLLQTIEDAAPEAVRPRARDYLGSFMFSGEQVEKKVKVLSGGEKGRLALCKMLLEPINFLVMDEPTNHLDMRAKDVLKRSLQQYDGTLIVVSHDREFLHGLTNRTLEFAGGKVKEHLGGIEAFLEARKARNFRDIEAQNKKKEEVKKSKNEGDYKERKQKEKELRQAERKLERLTEEVHQQEQQLKAWDDRLHNPEEFKKLSAEEGFYEKYEKARSVHDALLEEWMLLEEEVKALKLAFEEAFGND